MNHLFIETNRFYFFKMLVYDKYLTGLLDSLCFEDKSANSQNDFTEMC